MVGLRGFDFLRKPFFGSRGWASTSSYKHAVSLSGRAPSEKSRVRHCRRHAAEYGAAEFITKPVDFDFLKEQLRQLPASAD
jgi:hypothetical protein